MRGYGGSRFSRSTVFAGTWGGGGCVRETLACGKQGRLPYTLCTSGFSVGREYLILKNCCESKILFITTRMSHPPRVPPLIPLDKPVIYFLTICTVERSKSSLDNHLFYEAFCSTLKNILHWHVYAYIIMPDHIHFLLSPKQRDEPVNVFSTLLKRGINQSLISKIQWQRGSFDRILRKDEFIEQKWEYMQQNPVRLNLVSHSSQWPWISKFIRNV